MDKDIIRAYLWCEVIRIGFCPSSKREQKGWILQYGRSLKEFWEIDEHPFRPAFENSQISAKFSYKQICLDFDIYMADAARHNVQFLFSPANRKYELMWIHDVDSKYFSFPAQSLLNKYYKPKKSLKNIAEDDLVSVIEGMICHPCAHQHIESPIENHEIRIGGGISNPFLFLFHLRYQLCPFKDKRELEKKRLINLFWDSIKRKEDKITPNELLAQP